MVPQKIILTLCCAVGVALPLAVSALPKPVTPAGTGIPSTPGGVMPSTPGSGMPSTPGGLSAPKAQDLTVPGTGGGTTPAPTDAMPPSGTMPSDSPSPSASPSPSPTSSPAPRSMKKPAKSTTALVNVNTATTQQLIKVKGIGAATAKKIIMYRPYTSLEDLVTKKALTQKQLTDLKPQLTL